MGVAIQIEKLFLAPSSGSIKFLNATELHVLQVSTNQNVCVRYSFMNQLPMRSPAKEKVGDITAALTTWIRSLA